jgi:hypothetical protein
MKHENDLVAMLLVSCLKDQIAMVRGMQTRLRSYYKLNGRYFRRDYSKKTDLNHSARMVFGMANEMSEKEFLKHWMDLGRKLYRLYNMIEDKFFQKND